MAVLIILNMRGIQHGMMTGEQLVIVFISMRSSAVEAGAVAISDQRRSRLLMSFEHIIIFLADCREQLLI